MQPQRVKAVRSRFAFKHSFRFDIGGLAENSKAWRFRMLRKDLEVIAKNQVNPGGFEVGFYNYDCIHPTVASDIDDLVIDFKSFMSEVPTSIITE